MKSNKMVNEKKLVELRNKFSHFFFSIVYNENSLDCGKHCCDTFNDF